MRIKSYMYLIIIAGIISFGGWTIISSNPELKSQTGLLIAEYGLENDRYEWGLSACDWVLTDNPYNQDILDRRVKLLMALGRYNEAYSFKKQAVTDIDSITASDWETLGFLGAKTGDFTGAVIAYEMALDRNLKNTPEDSLDAADSLSKRASLLIKLQRYDEAIEIYEEMIEEDPENPKLWIDYGDAHLYKSLLTAGQIKDMYSSLKVRPTGKTSSSSKSVKMPSFESQRIAMEAYNKAVTLDPTVYPLVAAKILGNFQQTISSYQDILTGMNG